jgi:crossover junction endodeoxyribonuclease RuvC
VITLGIDPGTRHLGWGVILTEGNRLSHVSHGVIDVDPELSLGERLRVLDTELASLIARHRPAAGSVESLFFHRDPQAAAKLGHARGVVLLALARAGVAIHEYAPAHVKRAITGKGNADKKQVAQMIRALFALEALPRSDAADALALAVTHSRRGPLEAALGEQLASRRPVRPRDNPALAAVLAGRRRPRGLGALGVRRTPVR